MPCEGAVNKTHYRSALQLHELRIPCCPAVHPIKTRCYTLGGPGLCDAHDWVLSTGSRVRTSNGSSCKQRLCREDVQLGNNWAMQGQKATAQVLHLWSAISDAPLYDIEN